MPTVSVQPAAPAAPAMPGASPVSGGDGEFAATLGRALSNLRGGDSAPASTPQTAGRAKNDAAGDAAAAALAGTYLGYVVTAWVQPAPSMVPEVAGLGSVLRSASPEGVGDASGNFTFEGEPDTYPPNLAWGRGEGNLAAQGVASPWSGGAGSSMAGSGRFPSRWAGQSQGTQVVAPGSQRSNASVATGEQAFVGSAWGVGSNLSFSSAAASGFGETSPGELKPLVTPSSAGVQGKGIDPLWAAPSGTKSTPGPKPRTDDSAETAGQGWAEAPSGFTGNAAALAQGGLPEGVSLPEAGTSNAVATAGEGPGESGVAPGTEPVRASLPAGAATARGTTASRDGVFPAADRRAELAASRMAAGATHESPTHGSLGADGLNRTATTGGTGSTVRPASGHVGNAMEPAGKEAGHRGHSSSAANDAAGANNDEAENISIGNARGNEGASPSVDGAGTAVQPAAPAPGTDQENRTDGTDVASTGGWVSGGEQGAGQASFGEASGGGEGKSGQFGAPGTGVSAPSATPVPFTVEAKAAADPTSGLLGPDPTRTPRTGNAISPPGGQISGSSKDALSAWQNYDGGSGKMVTSAALTQSAHGGEMHVELRTGALGPLEVHAVVNDGAVGAEIHVQGQEAHTLLAAGLPSLERALGERNLRVENIAVYQDHSGGDTRGGGQREAQSGSSYSPQHQAFTWENSPQPRSRAGSQEIDEVNPTAGLSVRA